MSSRVLDSMETDSDGRLSSKSRLGCGGSWAQTGATKAAPMSSTAIPVADLAASTRLPLPGRVYAGEPGPSPTHGGGDVRCVARVPEESYVNNGYGPLL